MIHFKSSLCINWIVIKQIRVNFDKRKTFVIKIYKNLMWWYYADGIELFMHRLQIAAAID